MVTMKTIRLLLLFIIAALFLAYGYFEMQQKNRLHQQSDDLSQVRLNNKNELRLRFIEPMEGGMRTLIFTENGVLECLGNSQNSTTTNEVMVKSSGCKKSKVQLSKTDLERKLLLFSELKSKNTSCDNVSDGWGISVEGVRSNERFAFEAWNPDACENADAKKLHELLKTF
jgi:hypothetical protein